jgi:hypothetical protein
VQQVTSLSLYVTVVIDATGRVHRSDLSCRVCNARCAAREVRSYQPVPIGPCASLQKTKVLKTWGPTAWFRALLVKGTRNAPTCKAYVNRRFIAIFTRIHNVSYPEPVESAIHAGTVFNFNIVRFNIIIPFTSWYHKLFILFRILTKLFYDFLFHTQACTLCSGNSLSDGVAATA